MKAESKGLGKPKEAAQRKERKKGVGRTHRKRGKKILEVQEKKRKRLEKQKRLESKNT